MKQCNCWREEPKSSSLHRGHDDGIYTTMMRSTLYWLYSSPSSVSRARFWHRAMGLSYSSRLCCQSPSLQFNSIQFNFLELARLAEGEGRTTSPTATPPLRPRSPTGLGVCVTSVAGVALPLFHSVYVTFAIWGAILSPLPLCVPFLGKA